MSGKKKNSKQLLAHRVASIRWWIEKSGMPPCFLHLSPCVNQPLCHSAQTRGRGIMSSYLFCTKMKYLLGVNTYQEQTMGWGASSSQTHIWLPPPQRPNHVLGVFSDSGKSASFESTFQSPCWTAGLCWNGRETCVHTFEPIIWWSPWFLPVFMGTGHRTSRFLTFPHFPVDSEIWFSIFLIKHTRGERLIYVLAVGKFSTLALAVVLFSIKTPWAHTVCRNWTVKYRFYGGKMKHWQRAMRGKRHVRGNIQVKSNFRVIYRLRINVQYFKNKFFHIRRHWGWLEKEVLFSYTPIGPLKRLYY